MVTKHYFAVIITHQRWPNVPIKDLETGIAVSSELQNVLSNSGPSGLLVAMTIAGKLLALISAQRGKPNSVSQLSNGLSFSLQGESPCFF